MKLRPALAAALLLPLIGFGASWAMTHQKAQQGTDWDVPIAGYDPRDLLRGHYIQFRYEWPGLSAEEHTNMPWQSVLCIEGPSPVIAKTTLKQNEDKANCKHLVRQPEDGITTLTNGRLYVPQTRAREYDEKLRDPKLQGIVRVRVREDGLMTPRSLKFRQLTTAELMAREAEANRRRSDNIVAPPPPVVIQ